MKCPYQQRCSRAAFRGRSDHTVVAGGQILLDHEGDLEDDGIVELAQVETRELLDLLQTVDQRIAVDEQLAGGLGDIQAVLSADGVRILPSQYPNMLMVNNVS